MKKTNAILKTQLCSLVCLMMSLCLFAACASTGVKSDLPEKWVTVRLDGANEYEIAEVFGKILVTARGVADARQNSSNIVPDNPQASRVEWRVRIEDTDPFRLQANVIKMIGDLLDSGGEVEMKGITYRYTAAEVDLIKGIRPGSSTGSELQFVVDRELARDREFSGRHDPYKAREERNRAPQGSEGFE